MRFAHIGTENNHKEFLEIAETWSITNVARPEGAKSVSPGQAQWRPGLICTMYVRPEGATDLLEWHCPRLNSMYGAQ